MNARDPEFVRAENDEVTYCSSAESFEISEDPEDAEHDSWRIMDVPARHVHKIAEAIIRTLEANGIDPTSVVLAGYAADEAIETVETAKVDQYGNDRKMRAQGRITEINQHLQELYEQGILTASIRRELLAEINSQRAIRDQENSAPQVPVYHFADSAAMFNNVDHQGIVNNPIVFAGSRPDATIAVYDRATLQALPNDQQEVRDYNPATAAQDIHVVAAPRDVIDAAKILEFYPRYYLPED